MSPNALAGTGAKDAHPALWQCDPVVAVQRCCAGRGNPGSQSVTWVHDLFLNRSKLRSIIGIFSGRLLQRWRRGGPLGCAATTPTAKGDGFRRCWRWRRSFDVARVDVKPRFAPFRNKVEAVQRSANIDNRQCGNAAVSRSFACAGSSRVARRSETFRSSTSTP
jgi:hypothetical protein